MNLGNQIIAELGRRGLVGQFFEYAAYRKLHQVESGDDLRQFLLQCDYQSPPWLESASEAVDYFVAVDNKMALEEASWYGAALFAGLVVPFLDLFLWLGGLVVRLNRKSRKHL